ncbi:MAG: hypothetical protein N0E54_12565 [Candidatus Thiodiazotropha taylori]|nr:hypothetical protein [Candidatus Thiodiazotropha endolucinida]MCW4229566.1 hypothetical protein [Candidatus Thiodiazotropha taylori]
MSDEEKKPEVDDEIPLLEDVIVPDELASEFHTFAKLPEASEDSGIPEYDEVLLAMRDEIAKQLQDDLSKMLSEVLERAIEEAGEQITRALHDELDTTLEQKIRYRIDQRLDMEFGPRGQLDPEQD